VALCCLEKRQGFREKESVSWGSPDNGLYPLESSLIDLPIDSFVHSSPTKVPDPRGDLGNTAERSQTWMPSMNREVIIQPICLPPRQPQSWATLPKLSWQQCLLSASPEPQPSPV
jgi:hypothetical protein